jgi:hypothetical protein
MNSFGQSVLCLIERCSDPTEKTVGLGKIHIAVIKNKGSRCHDAAFSSSNKKILGLFQASERLGAPRSCALLLHNLLNHDPGIKYEQKRLKRMVSS